MTQRGNREIHARHLAVAEMSRRLLAAVSDPAASVAATMLLISALFLLAQESSRQSLNFEANHEQRLHSGHPFVA